MDLSSRQYAFLIFAAYITDLVIALHLQTWSTYIFLWAVFIYFFHASRHTQPLTIISFLGLASQELIRYHHVGLSIIIGCLIYGASTFLREIALYRGIVSTTILFVGIALCTEWIIPITIHRYSIELSLVFKHICGTLIAGYAILGGVLGSRSRASS